MKILNLGCGTKTSDRPEVVNIDWSIYLRLKRARVFSQVAPLFLRGRRLERFRALPENVMVYDLSRGIPFQDGSVDAVYHSHVLEHLDRDIAERFLLEAKRVLKPGGIHRIVVPDFEEACKSYVQHVAECEGSAHARDSHEAYIARVIEQSVRREPFGANQQGAVGRLVEKLVVGDARQRGETHQWMYDRFSLSNKLAAAGYSDVNVQDYQTSLIPGWSDYGLDLDEQGGQYKPGSVYVEAIR